MMNKPKEYFTNIDAIKSIDLHNDYWLVHCETHSFIINPYSQELIINNKKIDIITFHDSYKKAKSNAIDNYNEIHYDQIKDIDIEIGSEDNSTAHYHYIGDDRVPSFVTIEKKMLFNINEFKFTLAHEFAHFYQYTQVRKRGLLNRCMSYLILFLSLFILLLGNILLIESGLLKQVKISLLFINPFFVDYLFLKTIYSWEIEYNHQEEYLCDMAAVMLFPELNINHTFLSIEQEDTSFSHPSNINRLKSLLNKEMVFNLMTLKLFFYNSSYGSLFNSFFNVIRKVMREKV